MSKFPNKKPGDNLGAGHVNDLNSVGRQVEGMTVGGNLTKYQSGDFLSLYGNPAWHQYNFEITGNLHSSVDGYYKGKTRWWDSVASVWKTNDTEYQIDCTDSTERPTVGSKIVAYWDKQRGMFLPASPSALTPLILYDDVAPGDTDKNAWPVKADMTADTAATKVLVQNVFPGIYRGFGTNHAGFTPSPTAKVWCSSGPDGKLHIVGGVGRSNRCSAALTADAAPGASVTVDTVVALDGGQLPVANSTSSTIASCVMPPEASALDNAPCIIEWDENADAWKIIQVQQRAKMICGTLGGALTTTTASQTITSPVSMDGGQVPSGTVTGYNVYTTKGFAGPSGGRCVAAWNEGTDHYEFIDVECT